MSTPSSRLPFSALHEKFALVTSRNRWSMEMNFEWLRVGRPSNCVVRKTVAGRRCAATSAVVGDQGLLTLVGRVRVQVDAHGYLRSLRRLLQRGPEPGGSLEVERRADDGVPGTVDQVGHRVSQPPVLRQVSWHGPQRIDGRGRRTRALDRPQYGSDGATSTGFRIHGFEKRAHLRSSARRHDAQRCCQRVAIGEVVGDLRGFCPREEKPELPGRRGVS